MMKPKHNHIRLRRGGHHQYRKSHHASQGNAGLLG
jgi:hypothetical protein